MLAVLVQALSNAEDSLEAVNVLQEIHAQQALQELGSQFDPNTVEDVRQDVKVQLDAHIK